MKIAILIHSPGWANRTMYLNEIEERLTKLGITAKVFVIAGNKSPSFFDMTGIPHFVKISKMKKKLSEYDIFHIQFTAPLGLNFAIFSSLGILKKPIIIHTHGYDVFTVPSIDFGLRRKFIGKQMTKFTWGRAHKIITVCKSAKSEIVKSGIKNDKIKVICNGVDEKRFLKSSESIPDELSTIRKNADIVFLSVGTAILGKNRSMMFNAFNEIVKKYHLKKKIKLVIIGQYENNTEGIENQHIHFLGPQEHSQLSKFYSNVDAFILTSLIEGQPWALLEAMSCELPVIASNVGGIPEIIEDEKFLFNPLDQKDVEQKFEHIIEMSENERRQVGIKNRQRILDWFTLDRHVNQLKMLYEEVSKLG